MMQWCKNTGNHSLLEDGWKPRVEWDPVISGYHQALFKCNMTNEPDDGSPNGQWIKKREKDDEKHFHCLNRTDTNPFSGAKRKNETADDNEDTWLDEVNSETNKYNRRCLGQRPDVSVWSACKSQKHYSKGFIFPELK